MSAPSPPHRNAFDGARWLAGFSRERLVYATNVALIAVLALAGSFLLDLDRSYWALLTVALVSQASSGLTVWRSVARLIGTLVGAAFALVVLALFAQNSAAVVAALALWILAVGMLARFEVGLDAYAYAVSGLTALVIVFDTGSNAPTGFEIAVTRTTETLIGIAAAFVVLLVVFPVSASRVLTNALADSRTKVLELSRRAAAVGDEIGVEETQGLTKALSGAYANLRAQSLERSHRRISTRKATEATNRLNRLLIAAERMSYAMAGLQGAELSAEVEAASARIVGILAAVPPPDAPIAAIREQAAAFRAGVAEMDLRPAIRDLVRRADRDTSREAMALDALRGFALDAAGYLDAEAAIRDPMEPPPRTERIAPRYPDWRAAFERGLRPALVFLGLTTLWIASASSSFETLALIAAGLCVTLPAIAPRAALTVGGQALGLGFAAMFLPVLALEAALPYVETFTAFAALVGSVFFVFFYVCYDQMLRTYALGGAIFLATALQPSNTETYDALGAFNAMAALAFLPPVIVAAFTVLFPENQRWLRRHLDDAGTRLLARAARGRDARADEFLAQSLDAIGDYGGDLDLAEPANRTDVRRSRAVAAAGLELYELHRLRRLGHLPRPLAASLEDVAEAVQAEAGSRDGAEARATLDTARREALALASGADMPELARAGALRFALGVEFLELLVEDRRLQAAGG
ncbi:FUSC family protein [Aureimonas leprariae]|uniref:FUSC family protein n=1 Tax=Plantimonas leprariae TaxID=2615207 RepID=UPI001386D4BE|nr:FUSC family protein [Aureimonas leprariae]